MFDKWYNLKDSKPKFKVMTEDLKVSSRLLLLIDDDLYMGYYVSSWIVQDELDLEAKGNFWDESIELGDFSLNILPSKSAIYSNEFEMHDIFWCEIDANTLDAVIRRCYEINT